MHLWELFDHGLVIFLYMDDLLIFSFSLKVIQEQKILGLQLNDVILSIDKYIAYVVQDILY